VNQAQEKTFTGTVRPHDDGDARICDGDADAVEQKLVLRTIAQRSDLER
jgi:hypothetical protein